MHTNATDGYDGPCYMQDAKGCELKWRWWEWGQEEQRWWELRDGVADWAIGAKFKYMFRSHKVSLYFIFFRKVKGIACRKLTDVACLEFGNETRYILHNPIAVIRKRCGNFELSLSSSQSRSKAQQTCIIVFTTFSVYLYLGWCEAEGGWLSEVPQEGSEAQSCWTSRCSKFAGSKRM